MATTITRWGNSSGVRIPSRVLKQSRFQLGDAVDFVVNAFGNIELVEPSQEHRRVPASGRTTSAELYAAHPAPETPEPSRAWPSDDLTGAEWDAWSR